MAQRTFSIVKPDAVRKGYTGAILAEITKAGGTARFFRTDVTDEAQVKALVDGTVAAFDGGQTRISQM